MKKRLLALPSLLLAFSLCPITSQAVESENSATLAKIHGGAVVQLGATDTTTALTLAKTGRYIVHLLDTKTDVVSQAQKTLQKNHIYGVASAETLADFSHLPYSENLINLLIANSGDATAKEIFRVLVPDGALVITHPGALNKVNLKDAGFLNIQEVPNPNDPEKKWLIARKPWPDNMGRWSHPRHDANGNAVSPDTAVGEPKRIRWIAGHSGNEVEGMVSDGGRNFYGNTLTRDSFNGFRLWHRDLGLAKDKMDPANYVMKGLSRNQARPVATEKYLFAVAFPTKNLVAIDAATGEIAHSFPEIKNPKELVQHKGTVVATGPSGIYAFSSETGALLWKKEASAPRTIVAGSDRVSYIQGEARKGEKPEAVTVDLYSGEILWKANYPWLDKVKRSVMYGDQMAYEVSSFNNSDTDNGIHLIDAKNGKLAWEKTYAPGMNHARQARAMFIGDDLWIQQGGKVDYDDKKKAKFQTVEVVSLDPKTGETKKSLAAGLGHCAPPVATVNMIFSGVVEMTNLVTGELVTNSITKSNCSRENGFIPANGLIYATPKHCTCWPMLRGYVAMAPKHPHQKQGSYFPDLPAEEIPFKLTIISDAPKIELSKTAAADWPMYRHDATRSSSADSAGPKQLNTLWSARIAPQQSPLADASPLFFDWNDNPFVKGPITPPTIAGGIAYVARPNAHEVVAIDTASGKVAWKFTARGRVDTPPTLYKGLVLFGDHAGYVHALRADNGKAVWRFQAAPIDERMGAYGQIESAWPVAGSILIIDDKAYFAAGRQQLSDGGVFIFALDPLSGEKQWVYKINEIPQKSFDGENDESFGFYKNSGLEFDPVDLLHQEGDRIAMSRWMISMDGKDVQVDTWDGFAKVSQGGGTVIVPRGTWTYGFRQVHRFGGEAHRRSLTSWRNNTVIGAYDSTTALFRKDFGAESLKKFNRKWITGWQAAQEGKKLTKGVKGAPRPFRSDRVAKNAKWKVNPWAKSDAPEDLLKLTPIKEKSRQLENQIFGIVIDNANHTYVIHKNGELKILNTEDGTVISSQQVPAPMWDGLALAQGKLFLSTADGQLICIGAGAKVADAR
ncbi:MAG: PQQ-binding-like beta-propeller repeat protein [Verrucomicrobiales bacterium]|nr:PQQ-binding-like beta-propeller repeat protein [Verrucomicrobiales bacterium]